MAEYSEVFVAFDTAKMKHAVAIAEPGRAGEVRYVGEIASAPSAVAKLVRRLEAKYTSLHCV